MSPDLGGVDALLRLGESAKGVLLLLAVCTLRVYAAMLVLPATNSQVLQGVVRNGVALTIGLFIAWGQPLDVIGGLSAMQLAMLIAKEGLIGMMMGFAVATIFWTAEGVGVLIDVQAGYNNVQQTNPLSGEQSTPVGNTLLQLAITGFYLLGGFMAFVGLLFDSFQWWPLREFTPLAPQLLERFVQTQLRNYTEAVIRIVCPVVMVLVLIDLSIGLIAKTADKLEPTNLGQPIKGAVAVLMLSMLVLLFFDQARTRLALQPLALELKALLAPKVVPGR